MRTELLSWTRAFDPALSSQRTPAIPKCPPRPSLSPQVLQEVATGAGPLGPDSKTASTADCPLSLSGLAADCRLPGPEERPTFDEILRRLQAQPRPAKTSVDLEATSIGQAGSRYRLAPSWPPCPGFSSVRQNVPCQFARQSSPSWFWLGGSGQTRPNRPYAVVCLPHSLIVDDKFRSMPSIPTASFTRRTQAVVDKYQRPRCRTLAARGSVPQAHNLPFFMALCSNVARDTHSEH